MSKSTISQGTEGGMNRCEWGQYCHDDIDWSLWHTACHEVFCFNDGGPVQNGMRFCCYCGKPLTEHLYAEVPVTRKAKRAAK